MTITDGTAVFAVRDKRMQALVDMFYPVGTIIARDDETKPEILSYGKWEKIGENRVLQGAGGGNLAGTDVEAGLPNITGNTNVNGGNIGNYYDEEKAGEGAIYLTQAVKNNSGVSNGNGFHGNVINFDASKSNSIYGASETVQPPAHIVVFWKRIK